MTAMTNEIVGLADYRLYLERQGIETTTTPSSLWYLGDGRIAQRVPYHTAQPVSQGDLSQVMQALRPFGVRYAERYTPEAHGGLIVRTRPLDLSDLTSNWRHNVRRGLSRCIVQPITLERLASEGLGLEISTRRRQQRSIPRDIATSWRRMCDAAKDLPTFGVTGAFVDGALAGFLMHCRIGECGTMLLQRSFAQYLHAYPNNALAYVVTRTLFEQPEIRLVSYGYQSVKGLDDLDRFKFGMGYELQPMQFCTLLQPWLSPLSWRPAQTLIRAASRLLPHSDAVLKVQGIMEHDRISYVGPGVA